MKERAENGGLRELEPPVVDEDATSLVQLGESAAEAERQAQRAEDRMYLFDPSNKPSITFARRG